MSRQRDVVRWLLRLTVVTFVLALADTIAYVVSVGWDCYVAGCNWFQELTGDLWIPLLALTASLALATAISALARRWVNSP